MQYDSILIIILLDNGSVFHLKQIVKSKSLKCYRLEMTIINKHNEYFCRMKLPKIVLRDVLLWYWETQGLLSKTLFLHFASDLDDRISTEVCLILQGYAFCLSLDDRNFR